MEEQRAQKQHALLENEQLRMELEAARRSNVDHESIQTSYIEAESKPCSLIAFLIFLIFFFYYHYSLTRYCCSNAFIVVQKDHKPLSSGTIN